jgi:hypothetical protein
LFFPDASVSSGAATATLAPPIGVPRAPARIWRALRPSQANERAPCSQAASSA